MEPFTGVQHYEPRAYQAQGHGFLIDTAKAYLMWPPGTGKTVTVLSVLLELLFDRFDINGPVIIVATKKVADLVWKQECAKWGHLAELKIERVVGEIDQRLAALHRPAHAYVVARENFPWLVMVMAAYRTWPFKVLVWDEASGLKDQATERFKSVRAVAPYLERVIMLSGTPAPNQLLNLWPAMYVIDMGKRLGRTITSMREKWFVCDTNRAGARYNWRLAHPACEKEIHDSIRDVCMSVDVDLGIEELPPIDVPVSLSPADMAKYLTLERDALLPMAGHEVTAFNAGVLTFKLQQLANGAVYAEEPGEEGLGPSRITLHVHDAKLDALEELVEAAQGQPLLVLYWFKHDLARLIKRFPKARVFKGAREIADWQAGKIEMLLLHPQSAAHGVDGLQHGGSIMVWFSWTWSGELYVQALGRLRRGGQRHTFVCLRLVVLGTVDEDARDSVADKGNSEQRLIHALQRRIERVRRDYEHQAIN